MKQEKVNLALIAKIYPKPIGLVFGNKSLHKFLESFIIDLKKKKKN